MRTSGDFQLSTLEWLQDHHAAKYLERQRMVDDLGLRPGDAVLDLGCGPGLWMPMLAEKVVPGGNVVGLDISKELTDYAIVHIADHPLRGSMRLEVGNFEATPFDDDVFDAVFLGNCCSYASDLTTVLLEAKRISRGYVFSKDFDGGAFLYHPTEERLTATVLAAAARTMQEAPPQPPFDFFIGRKMYGAFRSAGFWDVQTRPYAIQLTCPLGEAAKRYVAGSARWLGTMAAPHLSAEDREQWSNAFDPVSGVLDREEFYFCVVEMITRGSV